MREIDSRTRRWFVLTSNQVSGKLFRVALRGYAEEEVDAFLDGIAKTLWEWEAGRQGKLTPADVETKLFHVALRGYAEEEVDQFLDEVVATLRLYDPDRKPSSPSPLEASDVEEKTLPVGSRGKAEAEFDGFLDKVAETVREFERRVTDRLAPPSAERARRKPPKVTEVRTPTAPARESPAPSRDAAIPIPPEPEAPQPPPTPPPRSIEPPPTVTRLTVTRKAESRGRPYAVLLDDQPIGKVSPGATRRFEIPTGMHWVTVTTRKEQSNVQVIEPHEGDQIAMTCGPATGDQLDDLGRKIDGISLEMAE